MSRDELSEYLMGAGSIALLMMSYKVFAVWETYGELNLMYLYVPLLAIVGGWLLSRSDSEQDLQPLRRRRRR